MPDTDYQSVDTVYSYYEDTVRSSPDARDYLCRLRIDNPDVFNLLHLGYSNRTLSQYLASSRSVVGKKQRALLKSSGIYSDKGQERFIGCLTMAIKGNDDSISQIIGYKIKKRQRKTAQKEILLNEGTGVFNEKAIELHDEVIVCDSVFNAMLFLQCGFLHTVSQYGGSQPEILLDVLKKYSLNALVVALPNHPHWVDYKNKLKKYCKINKVTYSEIVLPGDMDISSYYLKANDPVDCFLELIRRAKGDFSLQVPHLTKKKINPKRKYSCHNENGIKKNIVLSEANKELVKYVTEFIEWGGVKGHSKDTLRRRTLSLSRFINWCELKRLKRVQDIDLTHLQDYQRHLHHYRKKNGEPLTKGTQYTFLTPITTFFKWLKKQRYILYNPAFEMELPKRPRRLPRTIFNTAEIDNILDQPNTNTLEGIRDRAILETFYSTGIRLSEMVDLSVFDIDYHRHILRVNDGKDDQDYVVPLGERTIKWILQYLTHVRPLYSDADDEGVLFLNCRGKAFRRNALGARVKTYMKKAGFEVKGSCHLFRHAVATHMLENGADIRYIQELLGHEDITSTQIYTKVSIEKLQEVHARTHPHTVDRP